MNFQRKDIKKIIISCDEKSEKFIEDSIQDIQNVTCVKEVDFKKSNEFKIEIEK